jgi:hypothetical protein
MHKYPLIKRSERVERAKKQLKSNLNDPVYLSHEKIFACKTPTAKSERSYRSKKKVKPRPVLTLLQYFPLFINVERKDVTAKKNTVTTKKENVTHKKDTVTFDQKETRTAKKKETKKKTVTSKKKETVTTKKRDTVSVYTQRHMI